MERIPKPGEFYRHFKNKLYQILAVAEHTETGEQMVIYQALYGDFRVYARPLPMFTSEVDREKYPSVEQKYRFERVAFREKSQEQESGPETPQPNPYLLGFLEAETYEARMEQLQQMEGKVGQEELDSIYVVLDMGPETGSIGEQLQGIRKYLKTRSQFDGGRLRS